MAESELTSRERVLRTFRLEPTDRAPFDFMEGSVWPELGEFMATHYGLEDAAAVADHFDTDYRWVWPDVTPVDGPQRPPEAQGNYSDATWDRPLAHAATRADVGLVTCEHFLEHRFGCFVPAVKNIHITELH